MLSTQDLCYKVTGINFYFFPRLVALAEMYALLNSYHGFFFLFSQTWRVTVGSGYVTKRA